MPFTRYNSEPNIQPYKKKASQAFAKGAVVDTDSSGFLVPATASSTINGIVGIIMRDVLTTDADYALASYVEIDVPRRDEDWFMVDNAVVSALQTDVGETVQLINSTSVNVGLTVDNPLVRVEKVVTASLVLVGFLAAVS